MAIIKHWVNLSRSNTNYVGSEDIDSIEQLEYRLFECEFKKAKGAFFKVKIIAVNGKEVKYKKDEKNRNKNFRLRKLGSTASTGEKKKIKLSRQVFFPAAGGSQYKIEAKYKKKTVESKNTIEIWRRIFYQVMSMSGVPIASLTKFNETFKKYFIDMKEESPSVGKNKLIDHNTIYDPSSSIRGSSNEDKVLSSAKKYYKIGKYQPNAAVALFVKNIATYNEKKIRTPEAEAPSVLDEIFGEIRKVYQVDLTDSFGNPMYLWKDIMNTLDTKNYWFVSGFIVKESGDRIKIDSDAVTIDESVFLRQVGSKKFGFNRIKIEVDPEIIGAWIDKQKVFIEVSVRVVEGFSGGYSLGGKNAVFIATKAWWDPNDTSSDELLYILNHEIGHKIGMVAAGDSADPGRKSNGQPYFAWINKKSPNGPSTLYGQYYEGPLENNQGHQGPHCEKGATYKASQNTWSGTPGCVMFGATGMMDTNTNTYKPSTAKFCTECGKVVQKLDLNGDLLPALKNRFY